MREKREPKMSPESLFSFFDLVDSVSEGAVLWLKHSLRIHGGIFFSPFKESFPGSKAITEESKIKTE